MTGGRGFTLLELVMVVCIVALLGLAAIDRLLYLREQAEKAMVEQNLQMLKAAVRLQVAGLFAANRTAEIAALDGANPARWLEEPLPGYRGEFESETQPNCRACWYFDRGRREVVYVLDRGEHFQPDAAGEKRIRARVEVERPQEMPGEAVVTSVPSARLRVAPYRWFGG
ncbi:type II secretion system protein [Thiobacter aerophilum]|uniref:Type II secretion system protein n=1 Tax=Thiobacter aerophilum TaxID=3121275 RepID=A0ABV0EF52_9BURK